MAVVEAPGDRPWASGRVQSCGCRESRRCGWRVADRAAGLSLAVPTCRSRPVMTKVRSGSIRPLWSLLRMGSRLLPVMVSGMSAPAASRNVGARSMRLTKSSTVRPAGMLLGQRAARVTSQPMS